MTQNNSRQQYRQRAEEILEKTNKYWYNVGRENGENYGFDTETALDQLVEAAQELCRECVPERKPKVVKKRVTYAPYQPRVEKYKREGWNACREQMLTNLIGKDKAQLKEQQEND